MRIYSTASWKWLMKDSSRFPWDFPIDRVAHHFDGIFISNGPGDPTHCVPTVEALRNLTSSTALNIPIFGICLGHQLLALAAGAKTIKLKYGNRAWVMFSPWLPLLILALWCKTCLGISCNHYECFLQTCLMNCSRSPKVNADSEICIGTIFRVWI